MNKKIIPVILASATLLPGCFEEKPKTAATPAAPAVAKEDAIAVVNGTYISKKTLESLEKELAQRSHGRTFPKKQLIEELVQREVLMQDALKKQIDKSPEFVERMASIRNSLLSQMALQNYIQSNPVTDEEIRAEYDAKMGNAGIEYKARHILVKSEDEAKQLIEELNKGADFAELAKSKSTGPSGPQGGDLGWFSPGQMVAPFSEAVIALENGKFTSEPVQTQFGWHVILREDSRTQTPPPFEAVKEQIRPMLQNQKVQKHIEDLRNQAKVEILAPLDEEKSQEPEAEPAETQATEEAPKAEEKAETVPEAPETEAPAEQSEETEAPAEQPEETEAAPK